MIEGEYVSSQKELINNGKGLGGICKCIVCRLKKVQELWGHTYSKKGEITHVAWSGVKGINNCWIRIYLKDTLTFN